MNQLKRFFAGFLVSLCGLSLVACGKSSAGKNYHSYLPPEQAEMGERVQVDAQTALTVQTFKIVQKTKDQDILILSYDWENLSEKPLVSQEAYLVTVKQKGTTLSPDLSQVEDKTKLVTQNPAGETMREIEQGYVLQDHSPVEIALSGQAKTVFDQAGKPMFSYPVKINLNLK